MYLLRFDATSISSPSFDQMIRGGGAPVDVHVRRSGEIESLFSRLTITVGARWGRGICGQSNKFQASTMILSVSRPTYCDVCVGRLFTSRVLLCQLGGCKAKVILVPVPHAVAID